MPDMTPDAFRARLATVLGAEIDTIPNNLTGIWDLIGPALADHKRTRDRLAVDCDVFGIPTTNDEGPLSLHQMTAAVVKRWRATADDSADLAEIRARLAAAGYLPTAGEALGDVVARAIADTRAADAAREETEAAHLALERDFDRLRALTESLSSSLTDTTALAGALAGTIHNLVTR